MAKPEQCTKRALRPLPPQPARRNLQHAPLYLAQLDIERFDRALGVEKRAPLPPSLRHNLQHGTLSFLHTWTSSDLTGSSAGKVPSLASRRYQSPLRHMATSRTQLGSTFDPSGTLDTSKFTDTRSKKSSSWGRRREGWGVGGGWGYSGTRRVLLSWKSLIWGAVGGELTGRVFHPELSDVRGSAIVLVYMGMPQILDVVFVTSPPLSIDLSKLG